MKEIDSHVTVNGVPLKEYVEEQQETEIEKVHKEHLRDAAVGIGYVAPASKFENTSGAKSQPHTDVEKLSPEQLVHVNYLHRKGGTEAVADFLTKSTVQNGSIESAISDAEGKLKHFQRELLLAQQEITRWSAVVENLKATLQLVTGKAPSSGMAVTPGRGKVVKIKRDCQRLLEKALEGNVVLTRKQFYERMEVLSPGISYSTMATLVSNQKRKGHLLETENGLRLAPEAK